MPTRAALEPHSLLSRHRTEWYAIYSYQTTEQAPLDVAISSKAMAIMNSIEQIATETLHLIDN